MKERPILMCGEMVIATLEERKTQTRRTNHLDYINKNPSEWEYVEYLALKKEHLFVTKNDGQDYVQTKCPYGQPGDRLWVRETWTLGDIVDDEEPSIQIYYRADGTKVDFAVNHEAADKYIQKLEYLEVYGNGGDNWLPSIFMPRWASRITLEIVSVRVERVQDITISDCVAEGIHDSKDLTFPLKGSGIEKAEYRLLWDKINSKRGYSWENKPWVWAIEFKKYPELRHHDH